MHGPSIEHASSELRAAVCPPGSGQGRPPRSAGAGWSDFRHTAAMRRAIWLLLLGVLVAALGVATARTAAASRPLGATTVGTATTTTSPATTTSATTTTTTTSTTTATTSTTTTLTTTTTTTTSPQPITEPGPKHQQRARADRKHSSPSRKHRRRHPKRQPPDFPASPYPFLRIGGGLTPAAQANAVVAVATQSLGVPCKGGGAETETGLDCSGLVAYVFAHPGLSLPHYAAAQWY